MASTKTYMLVGHGNYPPEGPVVLGRIITDPLNPGNAINDEESALKPRGVIFSPPLTDFENIIEGDSKGKYGLFAKFLTLSFIEGKLHFQHSRSESIRISASLIEGQFFDPSLEFIEDSLRHEKVHKTLSQQKYRKNLYMIIGVKIATNAQITTLKSRRKGGAVKAGVDLTSLGAPVNVGPALENSHGHGQYTTCRIPSKCVYAYRLREIWYSPKEGAYKAQDYTKGAAAGVEGPSGSNEPVSVPMLDDFEVHGVADEDVGRDDLKREGDAFEVMDEGDGELVEVIVGR